MNTAQLDLEGRDFLSVSDFSRAQLECVLELAASIKSGTWTAEPLAGKHVCMLFQRPSHRTRVSFEVGISRLGGHAVTLGENDVQMGSRETVADAARVLDHYVDGVVARMRSHHDILELAEVSRLPVINALTDIAHPCQILADLLTLKEVHGALDGRRVAYVGDGNNVANSLIEASALLGFPLAVITPPGHQPHASVIEQARRLARDGFQVELTSDLSAVEGAAAVYTDVWASMGQEGEREQRRQAFLEYQVNEELMRMAPDAVFMHCLPAHRGEEVTDGVIDGPRSVVFQQAGNRLYTQMALMAVVLA